MNFSKSKKQLDMDTSELKEVKNFSPKQPEPQRESEEVVRVTAGLPQSVHERLLDLSYYEGFSLEEIMQEAAEMVLEKYNPKERPKKIKERRKKPGRPRKQENRRW